jgi:hypothetical protein
VIQAPVLEKPPARGDAQAMRIGGQQVLAAPHPASAQNYTASLSSMVSQARQVGGLSSGVFAASKPHRTGQVWLSPAVGEPGFHTQSILAFVLCIRMRAEALDKV